MPLQKQFLVSFDFEADYRIGEHVYRSRNGMSLQITRPSCHAEVKSRIGTVMHKDSERWGEFPPPEVMALFPGMVAARYPWMRKGSKIPPPPNGAPWIPEYQGGQVPEVVLTDGGRTWMWGPWARACADRSYEVAAIHLQPVGV